MREFFAVRLDYIKKKLNDRVIKVVAMLDVSERQNGKSKAIYRLVTRFPAILKKDCDKLESEFWDFQLVPSVELAARVLLTMEPLLERRIDEVWQDI